MKIKTILYTIILFCEIGITDTYALGGSDIRHCEPTEESVIINPDESPVLIYSFSKHEVYKLMQGDTCTGLVISDKSQSLSTFNGHRLRTARSHVCQHSSTGRG